LRFHLYRYVEAVNGYGYVQLRLHFKADLYPFYPPRISLIRPKLESFVPGAMIAHPKLHLRNWQPFLPIAAVIEHLRTFLARFARVDLASDMNDETRCGCTS
jgi:ubiquitin-protein ligase